MSFKPKIVEKESKRGWKNKKDFRGSKPGSTDENNEQNSLPVIVFQGRTYIQSGFEGCAMICDEIIRRIEKSDETFVPIGFDLEWPVIYFQESNNLTNKTALAQLCLSPKTCHLFHLYYISKLPAAFSLLLSHPKVKLVGVNVVQDIRKLGRDFPELPTQQIVEKNCIECGKLMNEISDSKERWSLSRLTAHMLKKRLEKPSSIRKGSWHKFPLSQAQTTYAATDAYVSLLVYLHLKSKATSS
ncbi:Werner Syndrome-like exonuclease isoform X2 [Venturia canescens]|uniref:Werner Syndrome-like exonuclease isoform X2 n=1 Tax=Venturia canescens TaxID=32260 RepID=UPI001C9C6156|nr:Werner Syndrome-like exonuclease isoform X2 [Venturia canescens]